MKVIINESEKSNSNFPKLMISNDGGILIIALGIIDGNIKGTVINSKVWPFGYSSHGWMINLFKDFKGSVILEND